MVATAVGGIPEIVDDGITGLLVPFDDEQRLVHALRRLGNDASTRDALAMAGQSVVRREYGVDAMYNAYRGVYEEILETHGRR